MQNKQGFLTAPQITKLADENPERFTVDIYGNKYEGTGYSVGFQELSPEGIEDKLKSFGKAMEVFYIGGWKDGDNYVLDLTTIFQDYGLAMTKARKYKQKAIYDFNEGEVITL